MQQSAFTGRKACSTGSQTQKVTDRLLYRSKKLLSLPEIPDAIVTAGLPLSLGAWQAVMEAHLRIPEDIAIAGYDVPSWLNPRFSTILHPHEQVAEYAGNLLIRWLDGETELESKSFDAVFEDSGSISPKIPKDETGIFWIIPQFRRHRVSAPPPAQSSQNLTIKLHLRCLILPFLT